MIFKYGFEYNGTPYGWYKKKLYRLPYTKNRRSYSLKEIPMYCFSSTFVFNISRRKMTINKLKQLTKEINITVSTFGENECPF